MAFTSLSGIRLPRRSALPVTISTSYQLVGLPENKIILESQTKGPLAEARPPVPLFLSAILIPPHLFRFLPPITYSEGERNVLHFYLIV